MRDEREPSGLVNGVDELLLLRRGLPSWSFHFYGQKTPVRQTADDIGNAAGVARDVRLPLDAIDAGVLVLVADDAVGAEEGKDCRLYALLKLHGRCA